MEASYEWRIGRLGINGVCHRGHGGIQNCTIRTATDLHTHTHRNDTWAHQGALKLLSGWIMKLFSLGWKFISKRRRQKKGMWIGGAHLPRKVTYYLSVDVGSLHEIAKDAQAQSRYRHPVKIFLKLENTTKRNQFISSLGRRWYLWKRYHKAMR